MGKSNGVIFRIFGVAFVLGGLFFVIEGIYMATWFEFDKFTPMFTILMGLLIGCNGIVIYSSGTFSLNTYSREKVER